MATAGETIQNDLTSCSICIETFTTPKYLPCLHTFCELCLNSWIVDQVTQGSKTFGCPVCRTITPPPSGATTDPSEWACKFPNNHLINSLIDQNQISRKTKQCDACHENGDEREALHWCKQCFEAYCDACKKSHSSMRMSKRHKIIGLQDVLDDLKQVSSEEMCHEHDDERIKLYCLDHDAPCCTLCAAVGHKKCEKVIELDKAADNVKGCTEFKTLLKKLSESDDTIAKTEKAVTENIEELNDEKQKIDKLSESLTADIVNHVQSLHKEFHRDLNKIHEESTRVLEGKKEMCLLRRKMIKNYLDILKKTTENASDSQIFLQMKRTKARQIENEEFVHKELAKISLKQLNHNFKENLDTFSQTTTKLGSVTITDRIPVAESQSRRNQPMPTKAIERFGSPQVISPTRSPKYMNTSSTACLSAKREQRFTCVNDCQDIIEMSGCFTDDGGIAVVDPKNNQILLCGTASVRIRENMQYHNPFGILKFKQFYVVSFPDTKLLVFINRGITASAQATVLETCYGLAANSSGVLVACKSKLMIYKIPTFVLNMAGQQITLSCVKSYSVPGTDVRQVAMDRTESRIFCTDFINCTVYCLDSCTGNTLFRFQNYDILKNPAGVTVDHKGNVYVVGCLSKNVVCLSPEGQFVKEILSLKDKLYHPHDLDLNSDGTKLMVTNDVDVMVFDVEYT